MSRKQESLRDLIESRAAWHSMAPRTLCRLALDAIAQNGLLATLPEGASLDTEFNHGGMPLTWRGVIVASLDRIERVDPSELTWFRRLTCDPTLFDKWLDIQLQAISSPEPSRLPVQKRPAPAEVRRVVQNYVNDERTAGNNTAIPRLWKYVQKELPRTTRDQAIDELRAIEGGPKKRGRPRRAQRVRK